MCGACIAYIVASAMTNGDSRKTRAHTRARRKSSRSSFSTTMAQSRRRKLNNMQKNASAATATAAVVWQTHDAKRATDLALASGGKVLR